MFRSILPFLIAPTLAFSGSAIFLHPDGAGLGHWNAARLLIAGPDGRTNWDQLEHLAAYRSHQANWLSTTSHAGATVHAYGKKVHWDSFGLDRDQPIRSASGFDGTILEEAQAAGLRTGLVNSGHIAEPGTAVFASRSDSRKKVDEISAQLIESGVNVLFSGGEVFCLPAGETGFFGEKGVRKDGRNLINEARRKGYLIIHTREELMNLPSNTKKVLGIFSANHTFNDETEETLAAADLPNFEPNAPTVAEMTETALRILGSDPETDFLLVAEEEGTDNFSNKNNASGMLDAIIRADKAIGVAMNFIENHPERETLLVVTADSDAGHPTVIAPRGNSPETPLPATDENGAPIDGKNGTGSLPFIAKPDANGSEHPFGIAWATLYDMQGSGVLKAHGPGASALPADIDNSEVFLILHEALFGE